MSLVTRILPPDEKGSKLTFQEMDNNLYYLQSLGVSGLTFSANTLTITNPTGGTKTTKIETLSRTLIPIGTTVTIEDNFQYFVFGDLVIQGVLNVKPNAEVVILNGDLINSGGTVNLSGTSQIVTLPEYNTFVTGGTFNQTTNSVLFTGNFGFTPFNVDLNPLKFTGGTITGSTNFTNGITSNTISATTYQNLPVTADTNFANTDLTFSGFRSHNLNGYGMYLTTDGGGYNQGFFTLDTVSTSFGLLTPNGGNVIYQTAAPTTPGIIEYLGNTQTRTVTLSESTFFTSPTRNFVIKNNTNISGATFIVDGLQEKVGIGTTSPQEKLDVSGKTKTINLQVTSGATSGYVLTSDSSGNGTWQIPTGGGGTFTGGTVSGATNFTNGITSNTISATTYQNLPLDVTVTGGTFSAGTITFTNTTGGTFNVTGITSTPIVNYTIYKVLLSFNSGTFTIDQLENTIGDGSNTNPNDIQWSNPGNGVLSATKIGAFSSSNVMITVSNINSGGVPYICTAQKATNNVVQVSIFLHDGTQLSTPNFNRLPFEIRIY
jgi:hypothetical protein